jgi:hypothetical protein
MYQSAFGRPPSAEEITACTAFLHRQSQLASMNGVRPSIGSNELAAWKDLAHALFNVKEFVFVK